MLAMGTRGGADPLRPSASSVCGSSRRCSLRADIKDTNFVLLPSAPVKPNHGPAMFRDCSAIAAAASAASASTTTTARKAAAPEARVSSTGSETSCSTPITDMSSCCHWSKESSAMSMSAANSDPCQKHARARGDGNASSSSCKWDHKSGANKLDESEMEVAKETLKPQILKQSPTHRNVRPTLGTSSLANDNTADGDEDDDAADPEDGCWSGEDDSIDAAVIAAVDGDLSLAAYLIPLLYKDLRNAIRSKVESWQSTYTPKSAAGDGEAGGRGESTAAAPVSQQAGDGASAGAGNQSRKRRWRESNSDADGDEDDDNHGGNGGGGRLQPPVSPEEVPVPLLACPFHKLDPRRYGIQHNATTSSRKDGYRSCAGPGFKSIQRLKEHLKRKHTPVQCERCYKVFDGLDKASAITDLTDHRRGEVPCEKGDPSLKEGISEAQWAALDKQNRKKNQEKHKVEKWFEIWQVLFPGVPDPATPWYDDVPSHRILSASSESVAFADLFLRMLNHKVQQGDISFPGSNTDNIEQRLRNLVQQTFRTYTSLYGHPLRTTDTSSSRTDTNNHQQSIVGGSSTHLSFPTNSTSQLATDTSQTTADDGIGPSPPPMVGPYTLVGANPGNAAGMPYPIVGLPMDRSGQPTRYSRAGGMGMMGPGMQTMTTTMAPTVDFVSFNQQELRPFYSVPVMSWTGPNVSYGTANMMGAHFVPAAAQPATVPMHDQLGQADFYGQNASFVPPPDARFDDNL